jgi:hypothetical protein
MQTICQMTSGTEHSSITRRFLNLSHVPAAALLCLVAILAVNAQQPATSDAGKQDRGKQRGSDSKDADKAVETKSSEVNTSGRTDAPAGESRRNENVQFNAVDNNALKELNIRLGTTATIVREFATDKGYFGAELGNAPRSSINLVSPVRAGFHGNLNYLHLNSIFTARTFFQVGSVRPARENEFGFNFGLSPLKNTRLFFSGNEKIVRGIVNGNVLVPRPDERTPLTTDPATRVIVARFLAAFPALAPNRTDFNPRALNTNAPQAIDNNQASGRLEQIINSRDTLRLQYNFTTQSIDAFQLVAGQNPDTDARSHQAIISWSRQWNAKTLSHLIVSYDRVTSFLRPEPNAVGPFVLISGLEMLGPQGNIPIDRAQNQIRYAGQLRRLSGNHTITTGFSLTRHQLNGKETDAHRSFFSFNNDFERDAITNLRMGTPSNYLLSIGETHRGFRNFETALYAGDAWKVSPRFTLQYGLRYELVTAPVEVNNLTPIPYNCDCNNFSPSLGFAYQLPGQLGVMRGAYGLHYGEIFQVTYQQVRFSPPRNLKITVPAPDLVNPLGKSTTGGQATVYALDPELAVPYSHQYNLSWEPAMTRSFSRMARVQLGYVGSRSHKLLVMWYLNRARVVPGIPQITMKVPERRPNTAIADYRWIVNGSRGYYDAARASLIISNWRGFSFDASYWFSKAIDLGAAYTNTAYETDSRLSRSQSEFDTHRDMKSLSPFDQTHALLWRTTYTTSSPFRSRWISQATGGWVLSTVVLVKTGTPFNVLSGSDGPGFGNVDGNSGDRPNILDPSILGRTISNPDTSRQMLPRTAFAFINPTDARGNLGRNVFRKGPIRNVNASLSHAWSLHQGVRLTFRAESINLFNTPQFAEPGFELANPNFGQITNTLNEGRTFRFSLQLGW